MDLLLVTAYISQKPSKQPPGGTVGLFHLTEWHIQEISGPVLVCTSFHRRHWTPQTSDQRWGCFRFPLTLNRTRRPAESHWRSQIQRTYITGALHSHTVAYCGFVCLFVYYLYNSRQSTGRTGRWGPAHSSRVALHSYDSADQSGSAIRRHQCFRSQAENRTFPSASSASRGFCVLLCLQTSQSEWSTSQHMQLSVSFSCVFCIFTALS